VSAHLYELGLRLRAADDHRPAPVARYAPVLPANAAVAVMIERDGDTATVVATDGRETHRATGASALDALDALGVGISAVHRTLVVPDEQTLAALARMAREQHRAASAPVVAWWDQRADHPGTGAVISVVDAARARWVLGVPPHHERDLTTWLRWLHVKATGPRALLDLAAVVAAGHTLPGLIEVFAEADTRSWQYHCKRIADGRDWRTADTRAEAALGLATRSDAAELYESLRLGDPLVAACAAFDGTVVPGTVRRADRDGPGAQPVSGGVGVERGACARAPSSTTSSSGHGRR